MMAGARRKAPAELTVRSDPGPSRLTCVVDGKTIVLSHGNLQALKMPMLKTLAVNFGLRSSGRKGELIARICDFAGLEVEDAAEEPRSRISRKGGTSSHVGSSSGRGAMPNADTYFPFHPNRPPMMTFPFCHCICGGSPSVYPGNVLTCRHCQVNLHEKCMRWDSQLAKQNNVSFICPSCQMRQMDPFYPVSDVLWMIYLHDGLPNTSPVETNEGEPAVLMSTETTLTLTDLHQWRRSNKEVIVRCVKLGVPGGPSEEYYHEWPRTVDITINANVESVFPPRPDHKRRDVPVSVTPYLKPHHNNIRIVCSNLTNPDGTSAAFAMGFFVCETFDVPQLVDLVCQNSWETKAASLARVCRLLSDDVSDDDVACVEPNRRLKLSCPITLMRMKVPSRGRHCRHLQCFDLESFIQVTKSMRAFNNRWKCPECPLVLRTDALIVDQYVETIIREAPDTVETVEVAKTGEWACIANQLELSGERSADEAGGAEEGGRRDDDDDDEVGEAVDGLSMVKCEEMPGTGTGNVQWSKPKMVAVEDIDSDDDESGEPTVASCAVSVATAWPGSNAVHVRPSSPGFSVRPSETPWTDGPSGREQFAGCEGSVELSMPASNAAAPTMSSSAPHLSQLTELLLTALSVPPAGATECIDLSPSTCSSTAATEPEDSNAAGVSAQQDAQRDTTDERPVRKRRRSDSGTCRTADAGWGHNHDGDADDDQRGHEHSAGGTNDGGLANYRHRGAGERGDTERTTHVAKRPCGRQCSMASSQFLEPSQDAAAPCAETEAATVPALSDALDSGTLGKLAVAMAELTDLSRCLASGMSESGYASTRPSSEKSWKELFLLSFLGSGAASSPVGSGALLDPGHSTVVTCSREADLAANTSSTSAWMEPTGPRTAAARGKFLPLQLPAQSAVPSRPVPLCLPTSRSILGRGTGGFEPLPCAPRTSRQTGSPIEAFLTPPSATARCEEEPSRLVLPERSAALPIAMRGVSLRPSKKGERRCQRLNFSDLVPIEVPQGKMATAGENAREFFNSMTAAL